MLRSISRIRRRVPRPALRLWDVVATEEEGVHGPPVPRHLLCTQPRLPSLRSRLFGSFCDDTRTDPSCSSHRGEDDPRTEHSPPSLTPEAPPAVPEHYYKRLAPENEEAAPADSLDEERTDRPPGATAAIGLGPLPPRPEPLRIHPRELVDEMLALHAHDYRDGWYTREQRWRMSESFRQFTAEETMATKAARMHCSPEVRALGVLRPRPGPRPSCRASHLRPPPSLPRCSARSPSVSVGSPSPPCRRR